MTRGDLRGRGGRAAGAEATNSFNALLQLHGDDDTGRHFLLDRCQQPDVVDGAAPVEQAAAASRSAPLYADKQYSSYGDVPATLMTRPFSPPPPQQQQHFSGLFGPSTRNFSDKPSVPPPMTTTKPLLLQALERKAFEVRHGSSAAPGAGSDTSLAHLLLATG